MDNHWFKQAKKYLAWEGSLADSGGTVGDESANPGPIDNKPLWKEDGSDIREHMIDEMDYVLVPEEAWDMLVAEFSLEDNLEGTSTAVKRKVVEHGMFVKQFKVRNPLQPSVYHAFVQGRSVLHRVSTRGKFQLGGAKEEEVQQVRHLGGDSDSDEGDVWDSSPGGDEVVEQVHQQHLRAAGQAGQHCSGIFILWAIITT